MDIHSITQIKQLRQMSRVNGVGRLDVRVGSMFSGKSSWLIHTVSTYEKAMGKSILMINHSSDNRSTTTEAVATHNNLQKSAMKVPILTGVLTMPEYLKADVIGLDEVHFFPDLVEFVHHAVEVDHKHVIVVGLDGDSDKKIFGRIHELICLADSFEKLTGICACGQDAIFSKSIVQKEGQVHIGASESYTAVCRKCFDL